MATQTVSKVQAFHKSDEWKTYFATTKESSSLLVIDFTATWCGPCKMIAPVFEELAHKYPDVVFVKIDVDELVDVAQEFDIRAMPTFLFLKKGEKVDSFSGANPSKLESLVQKHKE